MTTGLSSLKVLSAACGVAVLLLVAPTGFATGFEDYDTDGDGKISKAEFTRQAKRPSTAPMKKVDAVASEQPKKEKELGLIGWLERDFQVRQSFFTPKESVNPAKFSWSKAKGKSSFYHLDAAVLWKPAFLSGGQVLGSGSLSWFIQPSFEAHISNQTG
ncbi:MAG TPA: EF-hand domain-containing protein, partial [Chthoniobacterales bacterium]